MLEVGCRICRYARANDRIRNRGQRSKISFTPPRVRGDICDKLCKTRFPHKCGHVLLRLLEPIKRLLPFQGDVLAVKHLRGALGRLASARLDETLRRDLTTFPGVIGSLVAYSSEAEVAHGHLCAGQIRLPARGML